MKENPHSDNLDSVKQYQLKKNFTPFDNMYLQRGHQIFECNIITGEIAVAKMEQVPAEFKPVKKTNINQIIASPKTMAKVLMQPDCIYVSALNKKNAAKVLKREHGIENSII